jgi:hypothetical protein
MASLESSYQEPMMVLLFLPCPSILAECSRELKLRGKVRFEDNMIRFEPCIDCLRV